MKTKITQELINKCKQTAPNNSCEDCTCNIENCLVSLYFTLMRDDLKKSEE